MSLVVQKYGGTSVGSLDRIRQVAERVAETYREGHQVIVVVSARAGETDRLLSNGFRIAQNVCLLSISGKKAFVAATSLLFLIGPALTVLEAVQTRPS